METIFISSPYQTDDFVDNKRKYKRHIRKDVSVSFKKNLFSKNQGHSYLLDISSHGASICCRKLLSTKTLLNLNLTFDNNVNFIVKGKIRNIQKKQLVDTESDKSIFYYQYGIEFVDQPSVFSEYLIKTSLRNKLKGSRKKTTSDKGDNLLAGSAASRT